MDLLDSPVRRENLSATVRKRLAHAIVTGELQAGEKLAEPDLAARLKVSRAPIREALIGLEFEGLVQTDDRGRSVVQVMAPGDLEEIFLLRRALEPIGCRYAATHHNADALIALEQNIQRTQLVTTALELARLDTEFHDLVMQASGLSRVRQAWYSVRLQIELWLSQMQPLIDPDLVETRELTVRSHRLLLQAIQNGEGDQAARTMGEHLDGWRSRLPAVVTL